MQLVGLLILGAFGYLIVATIWKFVAVVAALAVIFYGMRWSDRAISDWWNLKIKNDGLAEQADRQHQAYHAGEPYGTYGEYPPEEP